MKYRVAIAVIVDERVQKPLQFQLSGFQFTIEFGPTVEHRATEGAVLLQVLHQVEQDLADLGRVMETGLAPPQPRQPQSQRREPA